VFCRRTDERVRGSLHAFIILKTLATVSLEVMTREARPHARDARCFSHRNRHVLDVRLRRNTVARPRGRGRLRRGVESTDGRGASFPAPPALEQTPVPARGHGLRSKRRPTPSSWRAHVSVRVPRPWRPAREERTCLLWLRGAVRLGALRHDREHGADRGRAGAPSPKRASLPPTDSRRCSGDSWSESALWPTKRERFNAGSDDRLREVGAVSATGT
jgi:hypothetical protein